MSLREVDGLARVGSEVSLSESLRAGWVSMTHSSNVLTRSTVLHGQSCLVDQLAGTRSYTIILLVL